MLPVAPTDARLAAALQPYVDRETLAGAVVLVANRTSLLGGAAVGHADIAAKTPMASDTLVWIASMTKPVTGALLMTLVDEGKVDLDVPISEYLPEFKDQWQVVERDEARLVAQRPSPAVTLRHLLSHTSGMAFVSVLENPTMDMTELKDTVRCLAATPLQWAPGTKYAYSNAGINTAGRIIEVVSGKPFEKVLDERLIHPLGMTDATFVLTPAQAARVAKSYQPGPERRGLVETPISQLFYPLTDPRRHGFPAGGLFATARDCARFCQMVLNGGTFEGRRYLSAAAVAEMTKRQTPVAWADSYGLGWAVGDGTAGHGGAHATGMHIDFKAGLVYIYLVQHANGFPGDGGESHGAFRRAAAAAFGG